MSENVWKVNIFYYHFKRCSKAHDAAHYFDDVNHRMNIAKQVLETQMLQFFHNSSLQANKMLCICVIIASDKTNLDILA